MLITTKNTFLHSLSFLIIFFVLSSASAFGHHGTNASYDMDKTVTLTGTVTEFVWSNPHCQLYFDVKDANGMVVSWGGETNSPGNLKAAGWTRDILKPGDKVTVVLHPSRAGTPVGVIQDLTLPNGKVLSRGGQAGL
jgi:hypothetical protein